MGTPEAASSYPATLDVDYPDRPLNRLTTFFRVFTIIPIAHRARDRLRGHPHLLGRFGVEHDDPGRRRRAGCCSPGRC